MLPPPWNVSTHLSCQQRQVDVLLACPQSLAPRPNTARQPTSSHAMPRTRDMSGYVVEWRVHCSAAYKPTRGQAECADATEPRGMFCAPPTRVPLHITPRARHCCKEWDQRYKEGRPSRSLLTTHSIELLHFRSTHHAAQKYQVCTAYLDGSRSLLS
jgi:hypothetical protein